MSKIQDAALKYLAAGFTTIPILLDGTKAPAVGTWRKFHEKAPTEVQIKRMFGDDIGLAVLGGKTSGGLEIIDFDRPNSFEPWRELVSELSPGLVERLPVIKTPGGYHVYLRSNACEGNQKLARCKPFEKDGKKCTVISETRGQGGYVLAPPSPAAAHPSGKRYVLSAGPSILQTPMLTDDERNLLLDAARSFNEEVEEKHEPKVSAKANGDGRPGDDFNAKASWDEILTPHGWRKIRERGSVAHWQRPGKADKGISATTGHCGDKLYVFSSSAAPFDSGRVYDKFGAAVRLDFGGDISAATRELRKRGFGAPLPPRNKPTLVPEPSSKWQELTSDAPPLPTEEYAPIEASSIDIPERMTATELETLLDNDRAASLVEPNFSRILATRTDDAEWQRVVHMLTRYKALKLFNDKMKKHDREKRRHGAGWKDHLIYSEKPNGDAVLANCITNHALILEHDEAWQDVLAFDEFSNQIITRRDPPFKRQVGQWGDADALEARSWMEQTWGIKPSSQAICEAILVVAKRASFNALKNYLDSLESHDKKLLDTWLIELFGAPDTHYTRAVGARWLISAVARAYEPGCKVDTVLILEGKQGFRKSSALEQLCPDLSWFTDGLSEFGSKTQAEEVEGKWIIELGELKGFGRELEQIKAFITRRAENYRPAYARYSIHSPRKCVFAGTVNPSSSGYLRDETGNRRFWPVECTRQAPIISRHLRDRLWAEARDRYRAGEKWWLEEEDLQKAATAEQDKRVYMDPWHELIEAGIQGQESVSVDDVMDILKIERARRGVGESMRIGRVLTALKWERFQKRWTDGRRTWRYKNPVFAVQEEFQGFESAVS